MIMTHASLFSGIGGFDLAAEWVGWRNLFNCELDGFCQRVLKYHFPNAEQYTDIRTTDFTIWRGLVDVLTGGFPCQPFSRAGKRGGDSDSRYMWPEMYRAIREICPRWVVIENVPGLLDMSGGLVFDRICSDLEIVGYQIWAFVVPACAVGAFHRRERLWIVAYSGIFRLQSFEVVGGTVEKESVQFESSMPSFETVIRDDFRSKSDKYGIIDGIPEGLDECSIAAYGNSVVPQVVYRFFDSIDLTEQQLLNI